MFYYIMPNGFPMQYVSFEAYFAEIVAHAQDVNATTSHTVRVPDMRDFRFNEVPAGHGFDGRPMKIWQRNDRFIGYEF